MVRDAFRERHRAGALPMTYLVSAFKNVHEEGHSLVGDDVYGMGACLMIDDTPRP